MLSFRRVRFKHAAVAVVAAAVGAVALPVMTLVACDALQAHNERALASDDKLAEVGNAMALVCNSTSTLFSSSDLGTGWLPRELAELHPGWVSLGPDGGSLGFGGGFHHWGYDLRRAKDGAWSISFTSEDNWTPTRGLMIGSGARVPEAVLIQTMKARYRQAVQNVAELHEHAARLRFLVALGAIDELRDAANDMVSATKDHVGARYIKAVIDGVLGDEGDAASRFSAWATAHPGFRHTTVLVTYLVARDRSAEATRWAHTALDQPLVDSAGDVDAMWNYSALGATLVGVVASLDPDLAVRLVDKVEKEEREASSRTYFRPTLEALRRRALDTKDGRPATAPSEAPPLDFEEAFFGRKGFRDQLVARVVRERAGR